MAAGVSPAKAADTTRSNGATWMPERLNRAQARMNELDMDGLLVTPGSDLRYLAGYDIPVFPRLTCFVVPKQGEPVLVVPELETHEAQNSAAGTLGIAVSTWGETDDPAAVVAAVLPRGASRVALSGRTWFDHALNLQRALGSAELVSAAPVLAYLRMRKEAAEVSAMREAGAALDQMFGAIATGDVPARGRTEREIFRDISEFLSMSGHLECVGQVASGPNSASPHQQPGNRRLGEGDVLLVDIAAEFSNGYRSDCTRMFCVGAVPDLEYNRCHQAVDVANVAAFAAARPGVLAEDVDRAAREVITKAGYGLAFLHRTGHGIGLDVHEPPFIVAGNDVRLEEGMCFSIEPGIYLPGRYGVRIEDIVTVTADGVSRLNSTSHKIAIL